MEIGFVVGKILVFLDDCSYGPHRRIAKEARVLAEELRAAINHEFVYGSNTPQEIK